jgi:cardiolipin synthase (CMP-forming)
MTNRYLKQLPNTLTTLRLLLAIPIWIFILREDYSNVLWLAAIAGLSDGVDGWLARKLDARSRYGAVADPASDKALLTGAFICLAAVEAIPPGLAVIVVARDLIIVTGALCYHWLIGRYEMAPSVWGKASTLAQVGFILMVLTQQVYPLFPRVFFEFGTLLVVGLALISGGNYVVVWARKAWGEGRKTP